MNLQPHYNTVNPKWVATLVGVHVSVQVWRVVCDQ